jgi:hypothetical protein
VIRANVIELPLSQRPLRVLTSDLSDRLAAINTARANLAAIGCTVAAQDVRQGTKKRPQLRLGVVRNELGNHVRSVARLIEGEEVVFRAIGFGCDLVWAAEVMQ